MKLRYLDRAIAVALLAAIAGPAAVQSATPASKPAAKHVTAQAAKAAPGVPDDPYLWLEEVEAQKCLDWASQRNAESAKAITTKPGFDAMEARFLAILDSKAKIPTIEKIGAHYYNFWKDQNHERGIWRRTSLEEYRKAEPAWETVIDLDALSKAESTPWVWHGVEALSPDYSRCLMKLSRGGADAEVVREFDLGAKSFVAGGFSLPEAKSDVEWKNKDMIYVATDFGPGSMTSSGYPRIVKEWKRGTPLSSATTIYEGKAEDVWAGASRDDTPGFERHFVYRGITFYTHQMFLLRDGKLVTIEKPVDADLGTFGEWMLLKLRTDWTTNGKTWPRGALLVTKFDDFMAGKRDFQMLFEPTARKSLDEYATTRSAILLNELDNVHNRIYTLRLEKGSWTRTPFPGLPEFGKVYFKAVDSRESDDFWLTTTDFTTPTRLHIARVGGGPAEQLKQQPAFFDASQLQVSQHETTSKDGTRIPYFQVSPKGMKLDGSNPTLLYGYGGFEISELPTYSATRGAGWLEKGGVLVVANIRGGGEFGPAWHQAGVKEQRHHCYEDFIAVGEDLVKRKITTPRRLGCIGGSNGGLLVGNMLVMRPDLFGAVVSQVPLLDMRRYHKLLAGASWMGEYGNPDEPKEWAFIQEWSPYQNVKAGVKYPPTLFTTSTRDDRVHPGHARKMVAKMLDQGHDVLYYENIEGGHGGAATNAQSAHMWALAYMFLWGELGGTEGTTAKGEAKQP
ncbi:MAG TPA: prolyl oligopeptidase family serine peptidase [Candidatus Eisenbacteria bacterium]|nr:prolyl oligopeptidase family serine peptidase [Candidatus Eisenbacteria bacterium]